ncbi:PREDICTED: uncharacterized protein LOC109173357 [Ipomoea nil]|uniref:uncharacterized protein LOC109173357 n=1 Tax=Ipomoea nil TaxID=35883 RepID=UPI00090191B6|nr:PREDICTED: uncharacterized protein LOC109173357 [Ipomoea nil]
MAQGENQNDLALNGEGVNQPLHIGRPISDYIAPDVAEHGSINVSGVDVNNFEIKPAIIQMAASDPFGGSPTEDPNAHIAKFLRIYSTFKINGVPGDAIKLRLFPFTLAQIAIKNQALGNVSTSSTPPRPIMMCELCGGEHNSEESLSVDSQATMEQGDVIGYGSIQPTFQQRGPYNPNAPRNHPGFSWSNSVEAGNLEGENEKLNEDVIAQDKEDEIQEIEPVKKHTPPLPFPQKFQKSREEERRAKFFSLIKQLDITIPLLDVVTEIPSYAKFLKEILSNKSRADDRETIAVSEECSALIQNKLLPKLRDHGSFSIPCVIGGSLVQRALCDLGASVSLMPYSLCQKLQLGEPKPTSMTLQLADRSVKYPIGIREDVSMKSTLVLQLMRGVNGSLMILYNSKVKILQRLNTWVMEVVKKEILKLLKAGIIYPVPDSKWVSHIHMVPKKGGTTVVRNEKNELIPTRLVTGWRMCTDYRKLNDATGKDHFPLPFVDQLIERMNKYDYFCFVDCFSGFFQIPIHPDDQEMTTFTCPYGTFAYRRMSFGLCNAPVTFQRCMLAIFSDLVEKTMEVFMDDFSVYGSSFDNCVDNLDEALGTCQEANLVLNWEKCHFMVQQGIVLGHKISEKGIEVDSAKVEVIEKLPPPISVKGIRSFLSHARFYKRFIKDFSKISKPLTQLLLKNANYVFDDAWLEAFCRLKKELTTAPIMSPPDWSLPFEIMCDASDYVVGAVLCQKKGKCLQPIYYASRTLDDAQVNYATTQKEMLGVVFAIDKFRSYLNGYSVIVHTDHLALKYLMSKNESKPRLMRWTLLLQEFDLEIIDKKGTGNLVADHLSQLENQNEVVEGEKIPINDYFVGEQLMALHAFMPWYSDFVNYVVCQKFPPNASRSLKKKLQTDAKFYIWDESFLYKRCVDGILRRCLPEMR